MPELTRRRSADSHRESWSIYCDDVRVGTIAKSGGVPLESERWNWSCGLYPGVEPGQHRGGSAAS
jgi:hypothetical protein